MPKQQNIKKARSLEPKPWTQEEDQILRDVVDQSEPEKWTYIAQILEERYGIQGRSAKDCKQRWVNDLQPALNGGVWTQEEEKKMLDYHKKFGNKWAKIAQLLSKKTDNCVKNYFYCNLRKGFKKINKFLTLPANRGKFREIKMTVLQKCIAVIQDRFQRKLGVPEELIQRCEQIKDKLFEISKDSFKQEANHARMHEVVNELLLFNRSYKKKKKSKINSRGKPKKAKKKKASLKQQEDEDQNEESEDYENSVQQQPQHQLEEHQQKTTDIARHENFNRELWKSRLASGSSMDFFGKLPRLGSLDIASRLGSISMQWAPYSQLALEVNHSKSSTQKGKLLTQSVEDLLDKNIKDFLAVPALAIPSFQSSTTPHASVLTTTSGQSYLQIRGQLNRQLIIPESLWNNNRQGFRVHNNPFTSELRKISSLDFENNYSKHPFQGE